MSKKVTYITGVAAVIAIVVMAYLYFENAKLRQDIEDVESDNLKLIYDSINRNPDLSEEVKNQLIKLIIKFQYLDVRIANEIIQALQLFQIGQKENAIEDLAKIVENLLREYYLDDQKFKSWVKTRKDVRKDFHGHLLYCYEVDRKINRIEFDFLKAVKSIRNAEDHDLDVNLSSWLNTAGITAAIDGIIKIAEFVYPDEDSVADVAVV